jgi:hypothetical protein
VNKVGLKVEEQQLQGAVIAKQQTVTCFVSFPDILS